MSTVAATVSCIYRNLEDHPQVVRVQQIHSYLERTVFPKQCLLFDAPPHTHLQIFEGATMVQSDSIPCQELIAMTTDGLRQYAEMS